MSVFKRFVGPRAPAVADEKQRVAFRLPNILLAAGNDNAAGTGEPPRQARTMNR